MINICQSWPGLQQTPLGKHQSEIANHRPEKPDMLSQHVKAESDKLSQHAECRQAIPTYIAKVIIYKGLQEPKTPDKQRQQIAVGIGDCQSKDNSILGS